MNIDTQSLCELWRTRGEMAGMGVAREERKSVKAHAFLRENPDVTACISWTVAGEFAEGFADIRHPAYAAMLGCFDTLLMEVSTVGRYARITAKPLRENQLIGINNL